MAITVGDNFQYQGAKPNFARDSFETLSEMKGFPETNIDDGHLSFCKEDGETYKFLSSNTADATTGKWRKFSGGITSNEVKGISVVETAPTQEDNILYFELEP